MEWGNYFIWLLMGLYDLGLNRVLRGDMILMWMKVALFNLPRRNVFVSVVGGRLPQTKGSLYPVCLNGCFNKHQESGNCYFAFKFLCG